MSKLRQRIYEIIEPVRDEERDTVSLIYDILMISAIVLAIVPLMFKEQTLVFQIMDLISLSLFIIDYLLRWSVADMLGKRKGVWAFVLYPFCFSAIIDLLSILPSFLRILNPSFKLFRLSRLLKLLRFIRLVQYYEPLQIVLSVLHKERRVLTAVGGLAIFYIFMTALIMFNVEYENELAGETKMFNNIFDAIYWSACTLTTVGYGDIYPVSATGRVISMLSAIVGVAIIALPSGVITAGYMDELSARRAQKAHQKELRAEAKARAAAESEAEAKAQNGAAELNDVAKNDEPDFDPTL